MTAFRAGAITLITSTLLQKWSWTESRKQTITFSYDDIIIMAEIFVEFTTYCDKFCSIKDMVSI